MADVFISYKKEERDVARQVVVALKTVGFSVWWDDDLTPRDSWDLEIEREIRAAKAVLVLWSPRAADETSFVRKEAGYALDYKKLVPTFIARCDLPLRFRDIQTVDLSEWDGRDAAHPGWRRTLSWIAPLVGREPRYPSALATALPQDLPVAPPPVTELGLPEVAQVALPPNIGGVPRLEDATATHEQIEQTSVNGQLAEAAAEPAPSRPSYKEVSNRGRSDGALIGHPRNVIIAVSGHTLDEMPALQRPGVRRSIEQCLDDVERAAYALNAASRFTLRSIVKEGADRFAADSALARQWRLVTPLPFSPQRYELEFGDADSKRHLRKLLHQARSVRPVTDEDIAGCGKDDRAPYVAAGRALIDRADLLLCVWDGAPATARGEAPEVAALMLEQGGLVLWISLQQGTALLIGPAPLPRAGTFRRQMYEEMAKAYRRAARPVAMRVF